MRRALLLAAIMLGALAVIAELSLPLTSERARRAVIHELSARLDSAVELQSLEFGLLPMPHASGAGLVVRHKGRQDVPPLVSIRAFQVSGNFLGLLRHHVRQVSLEGLDLRIPPTPAGDDDPHKGAALEGPWVVDEVVSNDAHLTILSDTPGHTPKVWSIHALRMRSLGHREMPFEATLTNAVPPGDIDTTGHFGPWNVEDPGATPLDGRFTFDHADLGTFKGISGILSAHGTFDGSLARISVDGETETPKFTVEAGGHPIPLHTAYHAVVDGLNGNTRLDPVEASFLGTEVVARGEVVDSNPGAPGREVRLDVTIDKGRIEDVLRLGVKASPPMQGAMTARASMILPPGNEDVARKLRLDGSFTLSDARFVNPDVSRKIAMLSNRSRGKLKDDGGGNISSDFAGRFVLGRGRLTIPAVSFKVPGAVVRLHGTYDIEPETIDFHGSLLTAVKVSEMTSGFKSLLLKLIDPLFHRDGGGADIPIQVTGTREQPSFGVDKGRVF